jgi:polyribonucleotide nucleotidyltransferase
LKDALDTKKYSKTESYSLIKEIKGELAKELPADDPTAKKKLSTYYELVRERIFREQVTKDRIRPDRRAFDQIREITIETSVLPRTHGSALFTRGETQALVTATLGTTDDAALQLPALLGGGSRPHDGCWAPRDWAWSVGGACNCSGSAFGR